MGAISKLTPKEAGAFISKLKPNCECLEYPLRNVYLRGTKVTAYRVGAAILQDVPENVSVRHMCNNRKCCNPDHLRLGTNAENIQDKVITNRCKRRHRCKGVRQCWLCKYNTLFDLNPPTC